MMSQLRFRNVDVEPSDPVESWPYEALVTALERGYLSDWRRIAATIYADPWGDVARSVMCAVTTHELDGVAVLLERVIQRARDAAKVSERAEIAERMRNLVEASSLSRAEFARRAGTSEPRLSTYLSGRVVPSASLLVRFERVAARARGLAGSGWPQPSAENC